VNNLTDARYFAAMGVDFLGFCCNTGTELYCTPSKIREITEWVEGPLFVLEFDGWQHEDEIKAILDSGLGQALHVGAFSTYTTHFGVPLFKDIILDAIEEADLTQVDFPVIRSDKPFGCLSEKSLEALLTMSKTKQIFLDLPFDTSDIETLSSALPECGLIVRGGTEEKTGIKSFADLDDIFDLLSADM
jgi:phosphoribosylanthranilate isomerase